MSASIVFTGGGSAGHVTPNIALIKGFQQEQWQIHYVGSHEGIEANMIGQLQVPFHGIQSGKIRRYFSWQNFIDPFKVMVGIVQSYCLLRKIKPDVVFSKGGFVAFPVVFAAWLRKIPVVAHESDMTPGLANKLCLPFVNKICLNFQAASKYLKKGIAYQVTGTPIREALFQGDKNRGLALCGFQAGKPCLLIMGGSVGAQNINTVIRQALPTLTKTYQVIHLCGKGKCDSQYQNYPAYKQFEYANEELADLLAATDVMVSRSGANALCEIIALHKPHVLVPLSRKASRGDQIQNAAYFKSLGISQVIEDEAISEANLLDALNTIETHHDEIVNKMKALDIQSATQNIMNIIKINARQ